MRPLARRLAATLGALTLALAACSAPQPPEDTGLASPAPPAISPAPQAETPTPAPATDPVLDQQAVAAAHPAAVDAGQEILREGGNAADAAVATAFAVSVVEPYASGMGGGGAAILAAPGEDPISYDYREVVALHGRIPASGTGVPGFVAGLGQLHAEHGALDWDELLTPAIELAAEGFPVSEFLAQRMRTDSGPAALVGLDQFAGPDGRPLREGQTLVQEDLADTLRTVSEEGPDTFYTGTVAEQLTAVDGLDAETLAAYAPERVEPVSGAFGGFEVYSAAPPLPGITVIQQLQLAEALGIADHEPGSAGYVERLSEAWSAANASLIEHLGDPDFVEVPVEELTDAGRNAALAEGLTVLTGAQADAAVSADGVRADATQADAAGAAGTREAADVVLAADRPVTAGNTTHLTVVDADGLTVSMTNTITDFWGGPRSGSVGGFFLNNQLTRFASIDTPANQPEPGRKSVSWSAPSIVVDAAGRPVLGLGTPGGPRIPNILASVLVPWALQDASIEAAVASPRYHLLDGVLTVEETPSSDLSRLLAERSWRLRPTVLDEAIFGSVQALEIDYDSSTIAGAPDSRREAAVAIENVSTAGGSPESAAGGSPESAPGGDGEG